LETVIFTTFPDESTVALTTRGILDPSSVVRLHVNVKVCRSRAGRPGGAAPSFLTRRGSTPDGQGATSGSTPAISGNSSATCRFTASIISRLSSDMDRTTPLRSNSPGTVYHGSRQFSCGRLFSLFTPPSPRAPVRSSAPPERPDHLSPFYGIPIHPTDQSDDTTKIGSANSTNSRSVFLSSASRKPCRSSIVSANSTFARRNA